MKYAVIDIESTGLNRYKNDITFIGIGLAKEIGKPIEKYRAYDMNVPDEVEAFKRMCERLYKSKVCVVWQNGKFDTLFIEQKLGLKLPISEDVMVLATAYDLAEEHGLKAMAKRYLGVPDWDISKKEKTSKESGTVLPYLKKDVIYTWEVFCYLMKRCNEQQLKIYYDLLLPAYKAYRIVERIGAYVDIDILRSVKKEYAEVEKVKLEKLNSIAKINWNSAPQIAELMYDKLDLPIIKKSKKTGKPSADKGALNRLAVRGYELPTLLIDYKKTNTLNKMFLKRWENDLGTDGRMHPNFNLVNVVTGRTSASNPNLQQVPREKTLRSIFRAPKGRVFFEADYSQLELRIAADYAQDRTMLEIYRTGGDIHTETAKLMTEGRQPTKDERNKAKAINFGFLYGMMARKFVDYAFDSYNQVFTLQEADRVRQLFFMKYAQLLPWHKKMELLCEANGGVANRFGRFRKIPNIYSQDKWERLGAVRRAINTPIQGTGSDLLVGSMMQLQREHSKNGLVIVGTVHDSIIGEFNEGDEDWMVPEIKRIMSHPAIMDEFGVTFSVPLEADVGLGPWGSK